MLQRLSTPRNIHKFLKVKDMTWDIFNVIEPSIKFNRRTEAYSDMQRSVQRIFFWRTHYDLD
jgi:hypothetical protein